MLYQKTVFILDAYGLLYQLFYALPPMRSPQGEPVGAVYGFTKDLFTLIERYKPDYLFCAFDLHAPTFRSELYPDYKANRSAMPDDLRPQIAFVREILEAMQITPLSQEGFEADDMLATAARLTVEQNGNCVLVSNDKDCRQLINNRVSILNLRKHSFYKAEELFADWGIRPDQVVDFQSLVGDPTDNIPGIPLIGPKIAAELLLQYDTLEGIFENISNIAGKKRQENIKNGKEIALLSRQLVRLHDHVPIEMAWKEYQSFDSVKLKKLFQRFGFKSLLVKLETGDGNRRQQTATDTSGNHNVFGNHSVIESRNGDVADKSLLPSVVCRLPSTLTYHLIDTSESFNAFFDQLRQQTLFSFDTETATMENRFDAVSPRYTVIVGMSFAWNDTEAWYLPFRAPLGSSVLPIQKTLEQLRPTFENPNIKKIGQNLKYDAVVLKNVGVNLYGIVFDTMIADYLLRNERMHNLDDMAEHYLQYQTIKIEELIGTGKKQKPMDSVLTETVAEYAGEDALVAWHLYHVLKKQIENVPDWGTLFNDIEMPLLSVLTEMEFTGMTVDPEVLRTLGKKFSEKRAVLEREIYELAGHSFNIASPKQLAKVLFDELGLRNVKKTKSGQSTDMEVLEELSGVHPLPKKVAEHRQLAKLQGTYIEALPELIHPKTGRIHSSFNQVVTATGRLSSSHPNLQNIPVRTAEGREIRHAFVPGKGFDQMLSCDYSQIELRVLAHFSGDDRLCKSFRNDEDIHTRVASEVFGVKLDEVNIDMRRIAKTVNFGVIYGQSAFGLAKQLGISQKEAQEFIDGYFSTYSGIGQYLESILDDCIEKGYVATLFGRRRYFAENTIRPIRKGSLNATERMAINTVIQGTAADLMKQAMVRLKKLDSFEAHLLLQIHDELVFEVTDNDADKLLAYVVETMLLDQPLRVPLAVDAKRMPYWT